MGTHTHDRIYARQQLTHACYHVLHTCLHMVRSSRVICGENAHAMLSGYSVRKSGEEISPERLAPSIPWMIRRPEQQAEHAWISAPSRHTHAHTHAHPASPSAISAHPNKRRKGTVHITTQTHATQHMTWRMDLQYHKSWTRLRLKLQEREARKQVSTTCRHPHDAAPHRRCSLC